MRPARLLGLVPTLFTALVSVGVTVTHAGATKISPDGVWSELERTSPPDLAEGSVRSPIANFRLFGIDHEALNGILSRAPREGTAAASTSDVQLTLPLKDGTYQRFRILESPVFAPPLEVAHPEILSFVGQGVDDRTVTARFLSTPSGFYAFIRTPERMIYMEPDGLGNQRRSISYTREDLVESPGFECGVGGDGTAGTDVIVRRPAGEGDSGPRVAPSGATLSTYDLAVSATGEFTQFFDPGGGTTNTLSQIAASVAAVNAIYEPEVAIRFQVACNNVFTDPATDDFTSSDNSGTSIGENQTSTDTNCGGSAGYDIGHVFHRRGSGFSGLAGGNTCNNSNKARGYSSVPNPVPATMIWIVDQLSHEMGHQFTAAHIFNSDVTGCSGNRVGSSAYEPGSGSTIMSYAAGTRCDYDFPGSNDAYFHGHSFDQITNHRDGGGACGGTSATGNTPPTVNAGSDFTIPQGTPFTLTATGSDADGDALTYCWEQFDLGNPGDSATNVNGPLFRSRPPTVSGARTLPILSDILAGNPTPTEILPLVDRTLNFRVTVRDNRATGGGVNNDAMVVTVAGAPFEVTAPNATDALECGSPDTVAWNVGGGNVAPTVNILLSTNGGTSFPTTLAGGTANDGTETVTVPATLTSNARVRIDAVGNIFFNVSEATSITDTLDPDITCPADATVECTGNGGTAANDPQLTGFFAGVSAVDACDSTPAIGNNAPGFFPLGSTTVTFTADDDSGNDDACGAEVTVQDTIPPAVTILSPRPSQQVIPAVLPLSVVFASEEVCATKNEVIKLAGCTLYDGLAYGDMDGLLSDETIPLTTAELCRLHAQCGIDVLNQPVLRVEVTDLGNNVGVAQHQFAGSLKLLPICGP